MDFLVALSSCVRLDYTHHSHELKKHWTARTSLCSRRKLAISVIDAQVRSRYNDFICDNANTS